MRRRCAHLLLRGGAVILSQRIGNLLKSSRAPVRDSKVQKARFATSGRIPPLVIWTLLGSQVANPKKPSVSRRRNTKVHKAIENM